jgi:hypothetical protein
MVDSRSKNNSETTNTSLNDPTLNEQKNKQTNKQTTFSPPPHSRMNAHAQKHMHTHTQNGERRYDNLHTLEY